MDEGKKTREVICPACGEEVDEGDATTQGGDDPYHFWCLGNAEGDND